MRTTTAIIHRRNHFTGSNCNYLRSDCRRKICCTVPVAVAIIPTGSYTILGRDRPCIFFVRCPRLCLRHCAKDRQRAEQHCHAQQAGQPSFDIPHFHIKPSFLVFGYRAVFRHSHGFILLLLTGLVKHPVKLLAYSRIYAVSFVRISKRGRCTEYCATAPVFI